MTTKHDLGMTVLAERDEIDRLLKVNTELLAALQTITNIAAWHSNTAYGTSDLDGSKLHSALVSARAAIAKATQD